MVDTLVLEASALCVRVRVSLGAPNCADGEIGRHKRLKISRRKACRFDSGSAHQIYVGD